MQESIFKAILRRFFTVVATLAGVFFAFALAAAFFSARDSGGETPEINYTYSPQIEPNAQNKRESLSSTAPVILRMDIEGIIGLDGLDRHHIRSMLVESQERILKNGRIKGVFLVINTPGGTVTDADGIYTALKEYKEQYKVPVYAYVDGICASGGVYVSCAADKVYASDSSLIGSVGVIVPPAMNFSKLLTTVGVEAKTLYAGTGKDELNSFRPWKENEGANYQAIIDAFYQQFVGIVSANRPHLNKDVLVKELGANVFPANKALEYGYIDATNINKMEALALLAKDLNLGDDEYQVISMVESNWMRALFHRKSEPAFSSGVIEHRLDLPLELNPAFNGQYLYLYRP